MGCYLVNCRVICADVYVYRSPKRTLILPPKYHVSVLHICKTYKNYYATWRLLEKLCYLGVSQKTRADLSFRDQAYNRPTTKCWVKDFILTHKHDAPNFNQRFWQPFKHPKNVKSISNTAVFHFVSCRVIPRSATMKVWEKEVF